MEKVEPELWKAAAALIHRRYVAAHELQGLDEPEDKAHVLALGIELMQRSIAGVHRQPDELFHYTKLENLFAIISSGLLRATNAEQCNDGNEDGHRWQRLYEGIDAEIRSCWPRSRRLDFFDYFVRQLLGRIHPVYYISSFSAEEEDRTQWGSYAEGGRGVVIAMNVPTLGQDAIIETQPQVATLRPAIYEPEEQIESLRLGCDITYRTLVRRLCFGGSLRNHITFAANLGAMLCAHLAGQAVGFKDRFWKVEREWRVTVPLFTEDIDLTMIKTAPDRRKYIEIRYPGGKLPISRVIVGTLVSTEDEERVRATLTEHGYNVPVTRSTAPFR